MNLTIKMTNVGAILCLFFAAMAAPATAQTRTETLQAIAKLKGKEREDRVREGARKEGNLVWYSSATAASVYFRELNPLRPERPRSAAPLLVENFF